MNLKETLKEIGLSGNEIKVYLYLLDYGASKAGKIAKDTKLQRSSAYGAINSLVNKGLVSYALHGNIKHFQATSPNRIIEYIEEQKDMAQQILPELKRRHKIGKKTGQVRLFKGLKGVKAVFKDMIREGKDNDVFGDDGNFRRTMPIFCEQYIKEQNRINMKTRVLSRFRKVSPSKGTTYKFVDENTESNIAVNIYGNKVAIIIWTDEPEAIIIENEIAAKSFRSYFEFMWKHAKSKDELINKKS